MFSTIVVPLDGSSFSEAELSYALGLLPDGGDSILILAMASDDPTVLDGKDYVDPAKESEAQAVRYLQEIVKRIKHLRPWLVVRAKVVHGKPEKAIAQIADEETADLIIMSSHSPKGFSRWFHGSVTEGVLRETRVPVLVVHPNHPDEKSAYFRKARGERPAP
jgi:nucleotide-binding universal stress UspA family protein